MSIRQQVVSGLKWTGVARLSSQVISWLITIIVLRLLSPADYALMAISMAFLGILGSIAELGLSASVIRAGNLDESSLRRVAAAVYVTNAAVTLMLVIAAPVIASIFSMPLLQTVIQVSSLQLAFIAIATMPSALMTREMKFQQLALVEIASSLVAGLFTLGLAFAGAGVWALVAGAVVPVALKAAVFSAIRGWVRPEFVLAGLGEHLRFGGTLTLSRVAWQAIAQADVLIAGKVLPQAAVGIYSIAVYLATLPMQKIMGVVNQVAFPAIAKLQDEPDRLRGHLLAATRLLTVAAVPSAWGLAAVAPDFVFAVLGEAWVAAVLPLQIMCITVPMRMLGATYITAAVALGNAGMDARNTLVSAAVLIPAFVIGSNWGAEGMAIAWLVGVPIIYIYALPRVLSKLRLGAKDVLHASAPAILGGILMIVGVSLGSLLLGDMNAYVRLPALICVGAVVYLTVVWFADRRLYAETLRLIRGV